MSINDLNGQWSDAQGCRFSVDGKVEPLQPKFCAAADPAAGATVTPDAKLDSPIV